MPLEIIEHNLEIPTVSVMSSRRQKAAREISQFCARTLTDITGLCLNDGNVRRALVPYCRESHTKLRADLWPVHNEVADSNLFVNFSMTLGIENPDGSMLLSVENRVLPTLDLSDDPFAQGIFEYFRNQYPEE